MRGAAAAGARPCGTAWRESSGRSSEAAQLRARTAERLASERSAVAAFLAFAAFAAVLRLSDVCAPNFFVNRSTRPSVSISFCRPVKNGWQFEQISRCSSGFVDRVFHVAPHAQRASTSWYLGWMPSFTACSLVPRELYWRNLDYSTQAAHGGPCQYETQPSPSGPSGAGRSASRSRGGSALAVAGRRGCVRRAAAAACPGIVGAHGRVLEDEAQGQLGQVHAVRARAGRAARRARACRRQVVRREVQVPPVAFGPARARRQRARQAAFVERHARDDGDVVRLAVREQLVLRRLVEDVVDDLHAVDEARVERAEDVGRLPAVDADAERPHQAARPCRSSTARCQPSSSAHASLHTWNCCRSMTSTPRFSRLFSVYSRM